MKKVSHNMELDERLGSCLADFIEKVEDGLIIEFGVSSGGTMRHIISRGVTLPVYGFDTFEGLPEDWIGISGQTFSRKGDYKSDVPIGFPDNVTFIKGLIQDTLEPFLVEHSGHVAFVHFDMDLYSATKYGLMTLKDRFVTGTIICFDEIFKGDDNNEEKAMNEFLEETGFSFDFVGCWGEQGAFRLISPT